MFCRCIPTESLLRAAMMNKPEPRCETHQPQDQARAVALNSDELVAGLGRHISPADHDHKPLDAV